MVATSQILRKLQLLQDLVQREEESDEVMEVTVSKLLSYELEKLKERQRRIQEKLVAFEQKHGLKTEECSRKFREGSLGDEMDLFEWAALADIYQELSQQLAEAEQVSNASRDQSVTQ